MRRRRIGQCRSCQRASVAESARAVFVFLLGAILDRSLDDPRDLDRIRARIAALAGLP